MLGSFAWTEKADWFGGFSGMDLTPDGRHFYIVGDRGILLTGEFIRENDQITDVVARAPITLDYRGPPDLSGEKRDAEGVALRTDGSFCISFEQTHRVGCFAEPGAQPMLVIPPAREFERLHGNRSLEALAVDPVGALLTIPEDTSRLHAMFPVFRFDRGRWTVPYVIPRVGDFLPVGADFGPDGRLYLLERAATLFGFRSRVRSWQVARDQISDPRVHLETGYWKHDNLEGLSVWQDDQGRIRLTMISDDNFRRLQSTQIVEYAIPALATSSVTH